MSRHLPAVSGQRLIRALRRAGFVVLRQKGSHVALERKSDGQYRRTIVPMHREIRPGTLSDILNQTGLSKDDLMNLL